MKYVAHDLFGFPAATSPWNTALIREELFSVERLEAHAASLAAAQVVTSRPMWHRSLHSRLSDNESVLLQAYRTIAKAVGEGQPVTPAAEWLLDNYHLVEEQIRQIHADLPKSFYRELPKLAAGPLLGYPRVFGIAWASVAHSDSRFDPITLRRFVAAYQQVQPLTIGELWAVAITLRIVLVENLRRAAERIVSSRADREAADRVSDHLLGVNGLDSEPQALQQHQEGNAALSPAFVVQVVKRLRDQDPRVTPALVWLEKELLAQGTTCDQMVHDEQQRQGASNVTVRNIITSMRLISDVNWPDFFEEVSLVDAKLRLAVDCGVDFASMDFATRNLYRSAIEELARGSAKTELAIADAVIDAIRKHSSTMGANTSDQDRLCDPGYYLIAGGRSEFERSIGFRPPRKLWFRRMTIASGPTGYIGAIIFVACLVLAVPLSLLHAQGLSLFTLQMLALCGVVPALDVAVAIVNRLVTRGVGATLLPALALRNGVPEHLRTMVVVPTLLTNAESIAEQLERLEVHYLAALHGEIHFALLTDLTDALSEHVAGDETLIKLAADGIARLNRLHGPTTTGDRFYLFHRRRVWNEKQRRWMGWERKRGKLHELNRLLRGAVDTSFVDTKRSDAGGGYSVSTPLAPQTVRFVVTLDADTRLPRETVRRLVGKLAHPLNQPRFDATTGRVVEGYAILQPRVTPSLPLGREGSLFQRIFSSMNGIDPYDAAVADVYQDLFAEGSYAGKGIYDIDAFESTLSDRVPENSLLSHDLFEGTFARAGLASDIEVVEEFPSRYDVAAARHHRWARGDWQLLPWILGRGDASGQRSGSLPLIAIWKMMDNLRRTLSAPSCIVALVVGWLLPFHPALVWTAFVLATLGLPIFLPVLSAIVPRNPRVVVRSHIRALLGDLWLAVLQTVFVTAFIAHQAWSMLDAILRTLYRLTISHRLLLEWVTAAQSQLQLRFGMAAAYRNMSGSLVIAVAAIAIVATLGPTWWLALPLSMLWLAAPAIARKISVSPLVAGRLPISDLDAQALRLVARRTWRYFETFVSAADNMLPPDNFQEDPRPVLAHRTSPTNMGLYLLCAVSARDFGWAGTADVVDRLEATLATMSRLQRYRGHFYNWYDTSDLRPLDPQYVSSVDSGNLAAHLIAIANACSEWTTTPIAHVASVSGIRDSLLLTSAALDALSKHRLPPLAARELKEALSALDASLTALPNLASNDAANSAPNIEAQLVELSGQAANLEDYARALAADHESDYRELLQWAEATRRSIDCWRREHAQKDPASSLGPRLAAIEATARAMALAMEFDFLLDPDRKLLAIGFRATDGTLDPSCYDLLASEARLASFFAIAKNDVPTRHWFRLGREVTQIGHGAALISWSGSMFEYLMPSLVMRAPAGSLLEQTNRLIVRRQIEYGLALNTPWGISESAYSARDIELTYQYSNFGVPGLGLKRGLSDNIVVAPYATGLAAMVDPQAAVQNFARLTELGALGQFGFFEALDYTRSRLPDDKDLSIVRAYMAHHQGMTIVAIANVLFDGRMRARFHAESSVQATELLLQERTPRDVAIAHPRAEEVNATLRVEDTLLAEVRRLHTPHSATPQTHLLSNSRYSVMLTSAGSGYSRWQDICITRWREDTTRDDAGSYIFLRDVETNAVWSAGFQPCGTEPDHYTATFTEDLAEITRTDRTITTALQVLVSPEEDAEVRRVSITNNGNGVRDIEVTSYCELVLAPYAADWSHPAFSKLFVQTECLTKGSVLLATRRRRSPHEAEIWATHHAVVEAEMIGEAQYETDRARFVGRAREIYEPAVMQDGRALSNSCGTVLDPIFALRYRVRIQPGATARLSFWTCVAASRAGVLELFDKHQDANAYTRATTLAWTQAQVQLRHWEIAAAEANLFQRIAGHVLYANSSLRPSAAAIERGSGPRTALWAQGISGDVPIVLLRIDHLEDMAIARQLLQAHEYWRSKQLAVDIVLLNERASSYVQDLQIALETLVRTSQSRPIAGSAAKGSVFVLRTDLISAETRAVLSSVARVVFVAQRGSLADQLDRRSETSTFPIGVVSRKERKEVPARTTPPTDLEFFNGLGGFGAEGREYVVHLEAEQSTPAPWINVIANPQFGFQVAAEGGGYTWSINSRENQLTQWSNDPVTDRSSEVLYVRDEETGELFGPTLAPVRDAGPYVVRHGRGYSRFAHTAHGIALELSVFVPLSDSIKICRLRIRNTSQRRRNLTVTAYLEWVLGTSRAASAPYIVTEMDSVTGAMFARNPWNNAFASSVAFADLDGRQTQWTADRREFLGVHGRLDQPAALSAATAYARFSNRTGAGFDPCCALQTSLVIEPGATTEVVLFVGASASAQDAQTLITRYRAMDLNEVLNDVVNHWVTLLETIQVRSPDRSMDILLNGWLLYQTLACRMWARSAFYQASGAYGFRDQLQDSMALTMAQPAIAREHLLRAAARQFPEGDVQHWWLPPTGVGVRTRISDDRIWLAYCCANYISVTGDVAVLDDDVAFIEGAKLSHGEHDLFYQPALSETSAALFEHCARALDDSLAVGEHGLPLMGTGDWNDGMNRVGEHGRGESVWLGWFLYLTLQAFAPLAAARNDVARNTRWLKHAEALRESLERNAWDGEWYRRGYFDDGSPLGSASSDECRIDSIAQSWSVLSGAANAQRAAQAMKAVDEKLIRRDEGLALLFAPPFDRTVLDPGYVKGYPPGIRENGGQYTHAAAWSVMAFAALGENEKAASLFSLLNPINKTNTRTGVRRYKVEPYVIAADIYSQVPHVGRGGWTWYTGSAGWMYRAGIESILGLQRRGAYLSIHPCIPQSWPLFEVTYRYLSSSYRIVVVNVAADDTDLPTTIKVDDVLLQEDSPILLLNDASQHEVVVKLGTRSK